MLNQRSSRASRHKMPEHISCKSPPYQSVDRSKPSKPLECRTHRCKIPICPSVGAIDGTGASPLEQICSSVSLEQLARLSDFHRFILLSPNWTIYVPSDLWFPFKPVRLLEGRMDENERTMCWALGPLLFGRVRIPMVADAPKPSSDIWRSF